MAPPGPLLGLGLLLAAAWTASGAMGVPRDTADAAGALRVAAHRQPSEASADAAGRSRNSFTIEDDKLLLNGKTIQIIAGRWGATGPACLVGSCSRLGERGGVGGHGASMHGAWRSSNPPQPSPITACLTYQPCQPLLGAACSTSASTLPTWSPSPLPLSCACPLCSMHYFRIHPAYWEDRLARAKAMGINTVEVRSAVEGEGMEYGGRAVLGQAMGVNTRGGEQASRGTSQLGLASGRRGVGVGGAPGSGHGKRCDIAKNWTRSTLCSLLSGLYK